MDPLEFLARVLIHIPEPNKHLVRLYGLYANRVRLEILARARDDSPQGGQRGEGSRLVVAASRGHGGNQDCDRETRVETQEFRYAMVARE